MSSLPDVTSALAGAAVFLVGAVVPHAVNAADRILDRLGTTSSTPAEQPSATEPPETHAP